MVHTIDARIEKLKREIEEKLYGEDIRLEKIEKGLHEAVERTVAGIVSDYYEAIDESLRADRKGRRSEGLSVVRRGDKRSVLTEIGEVNFRRTYYRKKDGKYVYPLDVIAGIEGYERISGGTSEALVKAAIRNSYEASSREVTGGKVSKQTVMNRIRESEVPEEPSIERRKVRFLHIDADEDHVALQNGKKAIVPIISVYEGIERIGKRGRCINIFHRGSYGEDPEALWERVAIETDGKYDLRGTKVYIHGDGARWIKAGTEYFPGSTFVLDPYHKNKRIKEAVTGFGAEEGMLYEVMIRESVKDKDRGQLMKIGKEMLRTHPESRKTICRSIGYLLENFDAITIRDTDEEAAGGGATEPHVSHCLSRRLSSRPMGWSEETLKAFVPVLAAGRCRIERKHPEQTAVMEKAAARIRRKHLRGTLGLKDPEIQAGAIVPDGRSTQLLRALKTYC